RHGLPEQETVARISETARAAPRGNRPRQYIEAKILQLSGAFRRFRARDAEREAEAVKIAEELEAEAVAEEEVVEEPRPFQPDATAHRAAVDAAKAELKQKLRDALRSETAVKLLINATMGLGKTWST